MIIQIGSDVLTVLTYIFGCLSSRTKTKMEKYAEGHPLMEKTDDKAGGQDTTEYKDAKDTVDYRC